MAQPGWGTQAGSLGIYPAGTDLNIQLLGFAVIPAESITYELLSGSLPEGIEDYPITISDTGLLSGIPKSISTNTTYAFTVRITDNFNNISDRTFSVTIAGAASPKFSTPQGKLLDVYDSTWVEIPIQYDNPVEGNVVRIEQTTGELPPGLEVDVTGVIKGYAHPPLSPAGNPTYKEYEFNLKLVSALGTDNIVYSIGVYNQNITKPKGTRLPVILNTRPLTVNVPITDPYHNYYLQPDAKIPLIRSGEYFSFKVIGYDFDGSDIQYTFFNLPLGLSYDNTTGWVTGNPTLGAKGISELRFDVIVQKSQNLAITSIPMTFVITINKDVVDDLVWETDSVLDDIYNGQISDLSVHASSQYTLEYQLISGELPYNIYLDTDGQLIGRVSQQLSETPLEQGTVLKYDFTVKVFSIDYPLLNKTKSFTMNVVQKYPNPYENIYFKATASLADRRVLKSLLTDTEIIPTEYLYRPNDPYFGKAKDISYVHAYGMNASTIEEYIAAVSRNHYWRNITLGDLKTAVARNSAGDIIYEVVYSEIADDLVNPSGTSIPKSIIWPKNITTGETQWIVSEGDIYTSFSNIDGIDFYTSSSPTHVKRLYPASFKNMRDEVASVLGGNFDSTLLPLWMRTQQSTGTILGYIQAWVICYTLPGKSETIKNNILNDWAYDVNDLSFTVDRYLVDKSATFNYNAYLQIPQWDRLPGGVPTPDPIDSKDFAVLFPRKTILPKDSNS